MRLIIPLTIALLVSTSLGAQSPDYTFALPNVDGDERVTLTATITALAPDAMSWACGICADDSQVIPISVGAGADMPGIAPALEIYEIVPQGVRCLVMMSFGAIVTLPVGNDYQWMDVEYSMVGTVGNTVDITWCEWVTTPGTGNQIGTPGGVFLDPTTVDGSITIVGLDPNPPIPGGGPSLPNPGDVILSVPDLNGSEQVTVPVLLDNSYDALGAWSMSLCSDPAQIYPIAFDYNGLLNEVDFLDVQIWEDGVTALCIRSLTVLEYWPTISGQELFNVTYSLVGPVGTVAPIQFCNTLFDPPIQTVATAEYVTFVPDTIDGSILIDATDPSPPPPPPPSTGGGGPTPTPDDDFEFRAGNYTVDPLFGDVPFEVRPIIAGQQATDAPTVAFAMSLGFDSFLANCTGGAAIGALTTVGGAGPDYFDVIIEPDRVDVGCVYAFTGGVELLIGPAGSELVRLDFVTNGFVPVGSSMDLEWLDTPAGNVVIQTSPDQVFPELFDGLVTFDLIVETQFRRGDINGDGNYDLADSIYLLNHLFDSPQVVTCDATADGNGDGGIDISDPIYFLGHLFDGGPQPAAPFSTCGVDPSGSGLSCDSFAGCP